MASFTERHNFSSHTLALAQTEVSVSGRRYTFLRWAGQRDPDQAFRPTVHGLPMRADYSVTASFAVACPVTPRLVEQDGTPLPAVQVSQITLLSSLGQTATLSPSGTTWLPCASPVYRDSRLSSHSVQYSVQSVVVGGTNVVHAGVERFSPGQTPEPRLTGFFYALTITAHDAMLGSALGSYALLTMPDRTVRRVELGPRHTATVGDLPLGDYQVQVKAGSATVSAVTVHLSRDETANLPAMSRTDIVDRRRGPGGRDRRRPAAVPHQARPGSRPDAANRPGGAARPAPGPGRRGGRAMRRGCGWRRAGARAVSCALAAASLAACALAAPASAQADRATAAAASARQGGTGNSAGTSIPLFAYYYIWFSHNSWARAKTDLPLIGTYSSSDPGVMRHQIEQAKSAGITGFIVSWKDTPLNDQRLELLMRVAAQEHFKLAMIYEGLDFSRNPLPVSAGRCRLRHVPRQVRGQPRFLPGRRQAADDLERDLGVQLRPGGPGDQRGTAATARAVDGERHAGFERIAGVTDGDAYYWSSVNPATNTGYEAKLDQMSQAIRRAGKYWIAPFAPGFDARLVGGQRAVPRDNGQTLRTEYAVAVRSSPDMLGLISWNEFSENSYVEPSKNYGYQSLDVLRQLRAVPAAPVGSQALVTSFSPWPNVLRLLAFALTLMLGVAALLYLRRRHAHRSQDHSTIPH